MPQPGQFTGPVMRRRTGFYSNKARVKLPQKRQNLATLLLLANDNVTICINTVNLKNRLGSVQSDCCNLFHGRLLFRWLRQQQPSWHLDAGGRSRPQHHQEQTFDDSSPQCGLSAETSEERAGFKTWHSPCHRGPKTPFTGLGLSQSSRCDLANPILRDFLLIRQPREEL